MWIALERDTQDRQPLIQVATWCIGEFGDQLIYGQSNNDTENTVKVQYRNTTVLVCYLFI